MKYRLVQGDYPALDWCRQIGKYCLRQSSAIVIGLVIPVLAFSWAANALVIVGTSRDDNEIVSLISGDASHVLGPLIGATVASPLPHSECVDVVNVSEDTQGDLAVLQISDLGICDFEVPCCVKFVVSYQISTGCVAGDSFDSWGHWWKSVRPQTKHVIERDVRYGRRSAPEILDFDLNIKKPVLSENDPGGRVGHLQIRALDYAAVGDLLAANLHQPISKNHHEKSEYRNRIVEFLHIARWWLFYGSAALLGLLMGGRLVK